MAEFTLPLTAEGAVTAPSGTFALTVPTAETETFLDVGPVTTLELPEFGWAIADGVNPLRLVTRGAVYNCGGQAPGVAPTIVAGTRSAARLDTDQGGAYVIVSGDRIHLISATISGVVEFVSALGIGVVHEVLIGANTASALANLKKFINKTGVEGLDYQTNPAYIQFENFLLVGTDTGTDLTISALLYGTAGHSYVCTWDGAAGPRFENAAAAATTVFADGVDASGTAPLAGTYRYFYTHYRDADGAETGPSPIASVVQGSNANISLSVLTANADTTFDFTRIYRTETLGVEFFLVGTVPRATTTFTDDVLDVDLARSVSYNNLLFRSYTEGMPARGKALALWKGRLVTLGANLHAEYTRGTVAVAGPDTTASATVTFSVKGVTTMMVGRTFQVNATSEEYRILSVSESARTAVLDRLYAGATNATASFGIRDAYDASRIRMSVPFLFNQWPEDESPGRVDTDDVLGGTALLVVGAVEQSRLIAFSRTSVVIVTGDGAESWEMNKIAEGVGCVGARLVVGVEGGGMFLSPDGFYVIGPDGVLACISSPKAPKKRVAQGIDGTVARIAWANVEQGYAEYDRAERVVIFGLPLDGADVPNYEIVFDLQNSTWSLYKRGEWTALSRITLAGGGQALLAGDREGWLWQANVGESDGFYGAEAVQTLTGAQTVRVLTVSGTPFTTDEGGKPVIVLYADGVTVAYAKVASSTTSALMLTEDLATAPAANDQVVLGGIGWQAKTGFTTFGEEYRSKTVRSVTLRHAPTTRGAYFLSFAVNGGTFALPPVGTGIGALTEADGKIQHKIQWPGDTHSIQVRGFKPGGRAVLRGGVFDLVVREHG